MVQALVKVTERLTDSAEAAAELMLRFEERQKSRLRAQLDTGEEVGLILERGTVLRHGDLLQAEDGRVIRVRAAAETVSTARADSPLLLARACYHLGNRHIPLQIGETWVRYLHDHVLDAMVRSLGLVVTVETIPFEPEAGAYIAPGKHDHGTCSD